MAAVSEDHIAKSVDDDMDKTVPSGNGVAPAISLRNGTVQAMDIDTPEAKPNGTSKRKGVSNGVARKDSSSDDDDKPLVGSPNAQTFPSPSAHNHG